MLICCKPTLMEIPQYHDSVGIFNTGMTRLWYSWECTRRIRNLGNNLQSGNQDIICDNGNVTVILRTTRLQWKIFFCCRYIASSNKVHSVSVLIALRPYHHQKWCSSVFRIGCEVVGWEEWVSDTYWGSNKIISYHVFIDNSSIKYYKYLFGNPRWWNSNDNR
jgi:hypothetical protein